MRWPWQWVLFKRFDVSSGVQQCSRFLYWHTLYSHPPNLSRERVNTATSFQASFYYLKWRNFKMGLLMLCLVLHLAQSEKCLCHRKITRNINCSILTCSSILTCLKNPDALDIVKKHWFLIINGYSTIKAVYQNFIYTHWFFPPKFLFYSPILFFLEKAQFFCCAEVRE